MKRILKWIGATILFALILAFLIGFAPEAFGFQPHQNVAVDALTPGRYLSSPSLWIGLIFAALFIAAAVRLRRYRGPL